MSITDELRHFADEWDWLDYKADESARRLRAIADRIDAEHEAQLNDAFETRNSDENLENDGWVRLPKDADGECIHVGDTLDGYGRTIEVVEMRYGRGGWVLISRDGSGYADTFAFAHHAPTVEDVLREMLYKAHIYDKREMELLPDLIADYAKRLTLAESEDA